MSGSAPIGGRATLAVLSLFALRHMRRHPARIALAVMAIAMGVAVVVAILALNQALLGALATSLEAVSGRATLRLESVAGGIPQGLVDEIRELPGVDAAAGMILERVESPEAGPGGVIVMGVDAAAEGLVRRHRLAKDASQESRNEVLNEALAALMLVPDAVLLADGLARRAGLAAGDAMLLRTPGGQRRVMVVGVLAVEGPARAYSDSLLVTGLPLAQAWFGRPERVDRIDIVTAPQVASEVATRVEAVAAGRATLVRPRERGREVEAVLFGMRAMLLVVSVLALVVGAFLVTNTVAVALVERRSEIAVLRALGAGRGTMTAALLIEQTLLGLAGGALGLLVGVGLAVASYRFFAEVVSRAYFRIELQPPELSAPGFALAMGLAAGAALLAAWAPVRRALLEDPLVGMAGLDATPRPPPRGWAWRILAAAAVAGSVAWLLGPGRQRVPHAAIVAGITSLGFLFLAASPWLTLAARSSSRILAPVLGLPARLAGDHVEAARGRNLLTLLAIAIGVALAFEVAVTLESSRREVMSWIERTVAGDVMITRVGLLEPAAGTPSLEGSVVDRIAAMDGVRDAIGVRLVRITHQGEQVLLLGYGERRDGAQVSFLEGDPLKAMRDLHRGAGVLVSESFSRAFGTHAGDVLRLPSATGEVDLPVLGVVVDYSWPKGIILSTLELHRRLHGDTLVDEVIVDLEDGVEVDGFVASVRADLSDVYPDLFFVSRDELREEVSGLLEDFFLLSHAQSAVTLIVAFAGVFNSLTIAVLLRRRELAMLRAIGATRRQVALAVAIEGATLGAAGALLGVAFGAWVGHVAVGHASPDEQGFYFPTVIPWGNAAMLVAVCALIALIASLFPALAAGRFGERQLATLAAE